MTEATASLAVDAPSGAHFTFEEVKTDRGTKSLGDVPLLVWDDLDAMTKFYGEEGVLSVADGTSLRVSFQNIARRFSAAGKTLDDIATAQAGFRPGKRQGGQSTPASRSARKARNAIEKGVDGAALEALLDKIASGEISNEDIIAMSS